MKRRGAVRGGAGGAAGLLVAGGRRPAAGPGDKTQAGGGPPQTPSLGPIGPSPEAERQESSGLPKALKSINTREGTLSSAFGSADFLLIQPIYTFGLISTLRAAAGDGGHAPR